MSETRNPGGHGRTTGVRGSQSQGHGQPIFLVLSLEMIANLGIVSKIKIVPKEYLQYISLRLIYC